MTGLYKYIRKNEHFLKLNEFEDEEHEENKPEYENDEETEY